MIPLTPPYYDKYLRQAEAGYWNLLTLMDRHIRALRSAGFSVDTTLYDNGHDEIIVNCDEEHTPEMAAQIMEEVE